MEQRELMVLQGGYALGAQGQKVPAATVTAAGQGGKENQRQEDA